VISEMGFIKMSIMYLNAICVHDVSPKTYILLFIVLSIFYFVVPNWISAFASSSNLSIASNSSFIFNSTNKDINYYNYVNSVEGFTVNYPKNWLVGSLNPVTHLELDPDYRELVFFHSPDDAQRFSIYSHKLNYNFFNDLVNIFANYKQNQKSILDGFAITFFQKILDKKLENFNFKKSESGEVVLKNNLPSRVIVFEFTSGDKINKVICVLIVKDKKIYILEYESDKNAHSKNFNFVRSFIDSLKFIK
jgi:hypothetical protein